MVHVLSNCLYGNSHRLGNPRENQNVDIGGTSPEQGAGAAFDRGAGSEHIVDQNKAAAGDGAFTLVRYPERALYIRGALGPRQADLLWRGFHALARPSMAA